MSQVFTQDLLSEFVSKVSVPVGVVLMTRDEFFNWWMPNEWKPVHATRGVTEASNFYNPEYKKQILNHLQEIATDFGTTNISDVCTSGSIEPDYVASTFSNLMMEDPEYDALFAVYNPNDDFENTLGLLSIDQKINKILEDKMNRVLGFFFSQRGECRDDPKVVCVNLICIKKNPEIPVQPIKGALLFGAAIYCIKKNSLIRKTVYLELANGYENPAGLSLYSSYGFVPDLNLYAGDCFSNLKHMPMSVNLKNIKEEQIVGAANGVKYQSKIKYVRDFLTMTNPDEQKELGKYLKKEDMIEVGKRICKTHTRRRSSSSVIKTPYPNIDIKQLQELFRISDDDIGIRKRSRSQDRPGKERSRSNSREKNGGRTRRKK